MARYALDIDSTVFDFHRAVALLPDAGTQHIRAQDDLFYGWLADELGGQDNLAAMFKQIFTYDHMRQVGLLPGAAKHINALHDDGAHAYVMTRRDNVFAADTLRFLTDEGLRFDGFACENPFDKVARCQQLGIDVIVDDHPDTIREAHHAGLHVLTLRYPFNAAVVDELGIAHADTWDELAPMLADALAAAAV
jgi:phosphoglycolate phosphatase-like HAD superfamily hydrolase